MDLLRKAILDGEYLPGERLVEASLCERLGASRFIVRSALQDLAAEGLVEVRRNKGAHVRKVTVEITEGRRRTAGHRGDAQAAARNCWTSSAYRHG